MVGWRLPLMTKALLGDTFLAHGPTALRGVTILPSMTFKVIQGYLDPLGTKMCIPPPLVKFMAHLDLL
jgi:hypothetical protein